MINFLLNYEARSLEGLANDLTVLDYLRLHEHRCGTKEGCAEGDCGACTVVLVDLVDGEPCYRAVNSCILFTHELDGRLLLTVEGLKKPDGALHPVQDAMITRHASQCGFCTPGFVMSLFAYHCSKGEKSDQAIHEVLSGNLCRCTGYRPIVDAAKDLNDDTRDHSTFSSSALAEILKAVALKGLPVSRVSPATAKISKSADTGYSAPRTLEDLLREKSQYPHAYILAGGTDLGLLVTKAHRHLDRVLSVNRVDALKVIEDLADRIVIGSAVTYTDALPVIDRYYPAFGDMIRRIGSTQIRNLGTIGGNIANASPIGDTPPCLLALDATVVVQSIRGERRIEIGHFFTAYRQTALAPDEIIRAIEIPKYSADQHYAAYKIAKRFDQDISTVAAAFRLLHKSQQVTEIRMAFGGVAATPVRAVKTEAVCQDKIWNEELVEKAAKTLAEEITPLTDFRGSSDYRQKLAANLLRRFFLETQGGVQPLQVFAL